MLDANALVVDTQLEKLFDSRCNGHDRTPASLGKHSHSELAWSAEVS